MNVAATLSTSPLRCRGAHFVFMVLLGGWCAIAHAQSYTVSGTVHNLTGSGLQLRLSTAPTCLADDAAFTLHSTDPNDCFTATNINKCCSRSIKHTAFDSISTVTCTCGIIIIPRPVVQTGDETDSPSTIQAITVPKFATSFAFPTAVADISTYVVSIGSQPVNPALTCTVATGSGVINGHSVSTPVVTCSDRIFSNGFESNG
jgi:hypothetical protein